MMKILLIGGFGYLGQNFIKKYNHHDFIIFTRNSPNLSEQFSNVIMELGNIKDNKILEIIHKHKPEVVIHLAALSGLKKCENDPFGAFQTNVLGTLNVVKACVSEKCRLIFLSSREIYGETLSSSSSETETPNPVNIYGLTKMLSENIIQLYSRIDNLSYIILRLTNVYGPGGGRRGVNRIIDTALNNNLIQINGDGNQTLNLIFIDDVIDVINQFVENETIYNEIYNLGSNDTLTINQFCDLVSNLLSNKIKKEYFPKIDYENTFFKPNIKKLEKILKFHPKVSLDSGLKKTIESYKQ